MTRAKDDNEDGEPTDDEDDVDDGMEQSKDGGEVALDCGVTGWTCWFELICRIATMFPCYKQWIHKVPRSEMLEIITSDDITHFGYQRAILVALRPWANAFTHHGAPFKRRANKLATRIDYCVNKKAAVIYLRQYGHLPALIADAAEDVTGQSRLIALPPELRIEIWELVLTLPTRGVLYQAEIWRNVPDRLVPREMCNPKSPMYTIGDAQLEETDNERFFDSFWDVYEEDGDVDSMDRYVFPSSPRK